MQDWQADTLQDYRRKGFAERSGFGQQPGLLIVDFINGFTDPATPLGGNFDAEVAVTAKLLAVFRSYGRPIVYTTTAYRSDLGDGGVFVKKVPSLAILQQGSAMVEIDQRVAPLQGEYVVTKKYASAFFNTDTDAYFKACGTDSLVIAGCTTSGCIRASVIDSLQNGYFTIVAADAVGDRAEGPHQANLFDMDAKYADVMDSGAIIDALHLLLDRGGLAAKANQDFQSWWRQGTG